MHRMDREILEALDEQGGLLTRGVAEHVTYSATNKRARSGAVRYRLIELKRLGLVDYLDNEKPVCWRRTAAGSAALSRR